MKMAIIRGMVLGGSLGIFAALFGISDVIARTALTGTIAGGFAGYTIAKFQARKNAKK